MARNYWLDLFSEKTWKEFINSEANISGFRENRRKLATKIKPGDYFICYLTKRSGFIGVLEVLSESFIDHKKIWEDEVFPVRFYVKLLHKLEMNQIIPKDYFMEQKDSFNKLNSMNYWGGFLRGSPNRFDPQDAEIIVNAIKVKESKINLPQKQSLIGKDIKAINNSDVLIRDQDSSTHDEIQWILLNLGSDLNLDVWVAKNDRNKSYQNRNFRDIPKLIAELPKRFTENEKKIIEMIDVLWLQKDRVLAAFEIEHTTVIYSGLLRLADLVHSQLMSNIDLYIVAPDNRRDKIREELQRPVFSALDRPMLATCKFIPYSKLIEHVEKAKPFIRRLHYDFIYDIAESYE